MTIHATSKKGTTMTVLHAHKVVPINWSKLQLSVFTRTYDFLLANQRVTQRPKAKVIPADNWDTIAWNAAWIAALAVKDEVPTEVVDIPGGKTTRVRKAAQ